MIIAVTVHVLTTWHRFARIESTVHDLYEEEEVVPEVVVPHGWCRIGAALEDIKTGQGVELNPATGSIRIARGVY